MAKQYFSHDSNAKDDPKTIKLIDQLGLEGYGAYWVLIELLRDQPNFRLPIASVPRIARTYNIKPAKLLTVINSFQLFLIEDEYFFSASLTKRMEQMSESGRASAKKRWDKNLQTVDNQTNLHADPMGTQCQPNANPMPPYADPMLLKERKLKERKEEGIKAPTHTQTKEIFFLHRKSGWSDVKCTVEATIFFDHYESMGWKINGFHIENWQARARKWINDEKSNKNEPVPVLTGIQLPSSPRR